MSFISILYSFIPMEYHITDHNILLIYYRKYSDTDELTGTAPYHVNL